MSKETAEWLNSNILVGFTGKRPLPWWYDASLQPMESTVYTGAVPQEDVLRRLFNFEIVETESWAHFAPEDGSGDPTAEELELMVKFGLELATVRAIRGGRQSKHEGKKKLARSDSGLVLGEAADGYRVHRYQDWLLEKIGHILDDSELEIASAMLLRGGAVACVTIELPDTVKTPEGVEFRPFMLAATSADQTIATTYKTHVTNVVCDNTMSAALGEKGREHRTKHTKNSEARLGDVRNALELVIATQDDFAAEVAELCKVRVSDKVWDKILEELVPVGADSKRGATMAYAKRDILNELRDHDPRVAPWRKNGWGVVQAFNTYEQHYSTVKTLKGEDEPNRFQKNMLNTLRGGVDLFDQNTARVLRKVVSNA